MQIQEMTENTAPPARCPCCRVTPGAELCAGCALNGYRVGPDGVARTAGDDPHSDWRSLNEHELRLAAKPIASMTAWIAQQGELTWGNRVIFTGDIARALGTLHI